MGLSELFTKLFEPCRSAPKSPPCPSPDKQDKTEARAAANANDKTIVEVLPCSDVTNTTPDQPSPSKGATHAEGFAVNQVRMAEGKQRAKEDELQEEARQELILEIFGFEVHRLLSSKAWDDRAQAIAAAREKCERGVPETVDQIKFIDACCKLVLVCLQDKVMPIYFDGLELTKYLFGEMFPTLSDAQDTIRTNLEDLLPVIISKTADRNARANEGTRSILTFLAKCPSVGCSPVMAHIFTPIVNHREISSIRGRLELIDHVICHFGFGKSTTITMQLVMGFVRPHLDATDEKVRRAAIEVTVNCYKHKGDRTLKYITNVKPALLKLLEQRFAELDRPARGSRKHAKSAQGLPAVRGRPKMSLPKRESASQPCGNGNANTSFFSECTPQAENVENPELNNVLKDCPQLFTMGANTMVMSPLSSSAVASNSIRQDPEMMPGSVPTGLDNGFDGLRMGDDDLDADLMDEIEAY